MISLEDVKNYITDNLKVEVEYNSPMGLIKGNIKVILKLDGEIIDSDEKPIYKTYF